MLKFSWKRNDWRALFPGDMTLAEIMGLDAGGGHVAEPHGVRPKIATFAEALAAIVGKGLTQITVDFKAGSFQLNFTHL